MGISLKFKITEKIVPFSIVLFKMFKKLHKQDVQKYLTI